LSGALFPLVGLPKVLSFITKINPLSYGIDGMRYALVGAKASAFSPALSLSVLVVFTFALLAIGVYQFNKVEL
jgi:ABC-2 type transport system permease protein